MQTNQNYGIVSLMAPKKTIKALPTSVVLRPEDVKLVQELKSKTGIASFSDLARFALRKLAQAEGIGQ